MKRALLFFLYSAPLILFGQITTLDIDPAAGCSYAGEAPESRTLYGFESSNEADEVVRNILRQVGLSANFTIKAANVPNAQAHVSQGSRFILYSEQFMAAIYHQTGDYWSQVAILAHEIGHHLNGHTLQTTGSRPVLELEADKFSGFVLYKLGASLAQAQSAVTALSSDEGSATHPPKNARLEAVAVGYREARELTGTTPGQGSSSAGQEDEHRDEGSAGLPADPVPVPKKGTVRLEGKEFATVVVNGQTWLNENLDVATVRSWCPAQKEGNCAKYGRFYNWSDARKLCSMIGEDWRLPSLEDWRQLADNPVNYDASSGFNMQYGGYEDVPSQIPQVRELGQAAHYWTSSAHSGGNYFTFVFFGGEGKGPAWDQAGVLESKGRSVRCVKD